MGPERSQRHSRRSIPNILANSMAMGYSRGEEEFWGLDHCIIAALFSRTWNPSRNAGEQANRQPNPEACPEFRRDTGIARHT